MRPSVVAAIDLDALARNYHRLRALLRPGTRMMGVVKADAYGHGAVPVALRLQSEGAEVLGVARVEEGVHLREGGVHTPIFVLSGVYADGVETLVRYGLTPVVYDLNVMDALHRQVPAGEQISIQLKVDTGMTRLGFVAKEIEAVRERLKACPSLVLGGIMTHFADSDSDDGRFTRDQLKQFQEIVAALQPHRTSATLLHAANTGAVVCHPESHLDLVRPGLGLYGSVPASTLRSRLDVEPVMKLTARVMQVKKVDSGATVSYGRTHRVEKPTTIATIGIGYGDGVLRALSNRGSVLFQQGRAPILGVVCMDLLMADVSHLPGVAPGDEAVLLGRLGQETITAEEVAEIAGTIPYEVMTSVRKRVRRTYVGER